MNLNEKVKSMAIESKEKKIRRAEKIFTALKKVFPKAGTALHYRSPLELLIATILSAQCTDKRVNIVTRELFKKYRGAGDYASSPAGELEGDIRSTGFYRNKAKNIRSACSLIISDFSGSVPNTMEELLLLPGVARKTANCVLGTAFGKNAGVVVDTHVKRLSARLGLTEHTNPVKIERDLMTIFPQKNWTLYAHLLILHGRRHCKARKPDCGGCPIKTLCPERQK